MLLLRPNTEGFFNKLTGRKLAPDELYLIFVGEESQIDYAVLIDKLNRADVNFIGGIFPGIIHGKCKYENAAIANVINVYEQPYVFRTMADFYDKIPNVVKRVEESERKLTALTLVDGLTTNISTYLSELYNHLGNGVNFIGAGAGSLTLQQVPCIFSNEGIFEDAAILCLLDYQVLMGVRHGWEKLYGPVVATHTERNSIHELNWEGALKTYQKILSLDGAPQITAENFFDIAKGYPFGIYKDGEEDVVRDPISFTEAGSLICVGEVPENTVLYILKGNIQTLISAARQAVTDSLVGNREKIVQTLIIDCISRTLFLEEDFEKELTEVADHIEKEAPGVVPQGILSLGEISSYGEGYLEFFNKTIVVGTLYES